MGDRISFVDDAPSNARAIEKFRNRRNPKFFNINDMMGHGASANAARAQLAEFLVCTPKNS